ncbi:MAG: MFS transporter [Endomicrobium sp.]|jgi:OPA family glycerol-3-phosphate transporter-like MFS transporter/OPA family sugar phosphate sensor protein UhpC-like MFS transporter|nr:MFS transporter [Endomicrobium sp.]
MFSSSTVPSTKLTGSMETPEIAKKFKYWQIQTMAVTWVSYAVFFIMRKCISMATLGIQADLGISKDQLGIFFTLHGLIYGVSRFSSSLVIHKFIARNFLACGLVLCAICNFAFGCSSTVLVMGILWLLHGIFQGMGWPPSARLLPYWIHPQELATKMSIWNTSHCVGSVIILAVGGCLASLGWRNVFFVPSIAGLAAAVIVWIFLRDTPSSVGLPELTFGENYEKTKDKKKESIEFKKFIKKQVFKNHYIWILGISNLFVYVLRFAVLDWGPMLLKEWKGLSLTQGGFIVAAFEIFGAVGIITCGWVTDKYFGGKSPRVCAIAMALGSFFLFLFWYMPSTYAWVSLIALVLSGFFIYGVQSLVLVAVSNIATKRAAATANGFVGIWGYGAVIFTGWLLGRIARLFGWDTALGFIILFGVVGTVLLAFAWKAKATGYEELEMGSNVKA